MVLNDEVRVEFETFMDDTIEDATDVMEWATSTLVQMGIEPDLDSIISYISGYTWGQCLWHHKSLRIEVTEEIEQEFMKIMSRRAWELREAILRSKMV